MKNLVMGLAAACACAACHAPQSGPMASSRVSVSTPASGPRAGSGSQVGAADPVSAVKGFLSAAKRADLPAMSALWGDEDALARDRFSRDELQKRELVTMQCLRHDRYEIIGDAPGLGGSRAIVVQLTYGNVSESANIDVVRGPENRWYVRSVDMKALQQICMARG